MNELSPAIKEVAESIRYFADTIARGIVFATIIGTFALFKNFGGKR
jgi:hypothetical protein